MNHRVLIVHNKYLARGGEDLAVDEEARLLQEAGVEVREVITSNEDLGLESLANRARTAIACIWSHNHFRAIQTQIRQFRPTVVHCHNLFPIPSPATYYAARLERVPLVQTLHNYRLMCLNATFTRDSKPCFKCLGRWPIAGVVHRCYRGSLEGSMALGGQLMLHRAIGTWSRVVDCYVALTDMSRSMFLKGGIPAEKVTVKPNFVEPDPGLGNHDGGFALFVGRLSEEKGIRALLQAWQGLDADIDLRIVGEGPLEGLVREGAAGCSRITFLGGQPREDVIRQMKLARLLIVPSLWAEGLPFVILEAMAVGLPILCSDFQNLHGLVERDGCGWTFAAGSPDALRHAVKSVWRSEAETRQKGWMGRQLFQSKYCAEVNLRALMAIYDGVTAKRASTALK